MGKLYNNFGDYFLVKYHNCIMGNETGSLGAFCLAAAHIQRVISYITRITVNLDETKVWKKGIKHSNRKNV